MGWWKQPPEQPRRQRHETFEDMMIEDEVRILDQWFVVAAMLNEEDCTDSYEQMFVCVGPPSRLEPQQDQL